MYIIYHAHTSESRLPSAFYPKTRIKRMSPKGFGWMCVRITDTGTLLCLSHKSVHEGILSTESGGQKHQLCMKPTPGFGQYDMGNHLITKS